MYGDASVDVEGFFIFWASNYFYTIITKRILIGTKRNENKKREGNHKDPKVGRKYRKTKTKGRGIQSEDGG